LFSESASTAEFSLCNTTCSSMTNIQTNRELTVVEICCHMSEKPAIRPLEIEDIGNRNRLCDTDPLRKGAKKLLHLAVHLRFIGAVDIIVCVRNVNNAGGCNFASESFASCLTARCTRGKSRFCGPGRSERSGSGRNGGQKLSMPPHHALPSTASAKAVSFPRGQ
jgi:hypothetical protein